MGGGLRPLEDDLDHHMISSGLITTAALRPSIRSGSVLIQLSWQQTEGRQLKDNTTGPGDRKPTSKRRCRRHRRRRHRRRHHQLHIIRCEDDKDTSAVLDGRGRLKDEGGEERGDLAVLKNNFPCIGVETAGRGATSCLGSLRARSAV